MEVDIMSHTYIYNFFYLIIISYATLLHNLTYNIIK